ncbi:nucleolar protein 58-like [Penaeus vannamei]|uniref:nucleolar protein 58-like n=1 Tax=Penaeus vannamei TaxID=6689 RepID=UPI00387F88ED
MFSWKDESGRTRTPKHGITLDFEASVRRKTPGPETSEEEGEGGSSGTPKRVLQGKASPTDLDVNPKAKGRITPDPDPPWNENMEIKASDYLLPGRLRNNSSLSRVSPGKDGAGAYVPARRKFWKRRSKERKVMGRKTRGGNKNKSENIVENGFTKETKGSVIQEISEMDIREMMETEETKESEKQKWVVEEKRRRNISRKQEKIEKVKEENDFKNTASRTTKRGKEEAEDNTKRETEREGDIFRLRGKYRTKEETSDRNERKLEKRGKDGIVGETELEKGERESEKQILGDEKKRKTFENRKEKVKEKEKEDGEVQTQSEPTPDTAWANI